jgi:AcrR family transcriptional regulator
MANPRRTGTESSKTRFLLLDTTERLILDEGYAAVTSRRVAGEAGVTPPLVHYYFPTLDELFLAVFRRRAEEQLGRQTRLLDAGRPLHALWSFSRDPAAAALTVEFMALANHRKAIRSEIAAYAERFREAQVAALAAAEAAGLGDADAAGVVALLTNAARGLGMEQALGMTAGHDAASALVERYLDGIEPGIEPGIGPGGEPDPGNSGADGPVSP